MKTGNVIVGVGIGVLLTPIAIILAVLSAGVGHGHYEFARLFFPHTMLLTRLTDDSITVPLIILALAQFPLYGAIIGVTGSRNSAALTAALLLVVHVVAAIICFSGVIPNFS
jgi:hypothetical protein